MHNTASTLSADQWLPGVEGGQVGNIMGHKDTKELLAVMGTFIILSVLMISQVYLCGKTYKLCFREQTGGYWGVGQNR